MTEKTPEQRRRALKNFMQERGLKAYPWAKRAHVSGSAIYNFLKGASDSLRRDVVEKLAAAEGVPPGALFGEAYGSRKVRVVNYIGAGAQVFPIDDHAMGGGMYSVDAPLEEESPDDLVGLEVRGDSMRPLKDGWVVMYKRTHNGVTADCIGQICVVSLEDGRMYVKELRLGYVPGTYNLVSWNLDPIENVKVAWAAKVAWIRPK